MMLILCMMVIYGLRLEVFVVSMQDGKQFGDEYLAELDLIEIVEKQKADYESDVEDPENQQQSQAGSSPVSDEYVHGDRDSDRSVAVLSVYCLIVISYVFMNVLPCWV